MEKAISPLPKHVAIIMDRNGEWAKRRMLSRMMGHRAGVKTVKRIIKAAVQEKIQVLSLFAFSTENWLRPADEVSFLMKILVEFVRSEADELLAEGVKLVISGRKDRLPKAVRDAVEKVVEDSKNGKKLILNIALDYGGRDEITQAAQKIAQDVADGRLAADKITESVFKNYLYNPELQDVDLLIRTGGEQRISNFMLWQMAYAEFYFTPVLWPDFSGKELHEAIESFSRRQRRFGMTDEQIS